MIIATSEQMEQLGQQLGQRLRGGEVIELIGDVGAGKTTFTRGLARGLQISEPITSPSFTISCSYPARDRLVLNHYDFYRLHDAGIVAMELSESMANPHTVTIIEWGDSIHNILPPNHPVITIKYLPQTGRNVQLTIPPQFSYLTAIA